jgi:glycerol-3-phosphate acyltransferase PlsY
MPVVIAAFAYLCGSFPTGVIVGKLVTGRDVRTVGSGNIGAANVSRLAGFRIAILVLVVDVIKGVIPVLIGRWAGLSWPVLAVVAVLAVVGHDFSVFLRFTGGKGVATTFGVMAVLSPVATVIGAGIWLLLVAVTRFPSLGSLVALCVLPVLAWLLGSPTAVILAAVILALLCIVKHRENMVRLVNGQEQPIGRGNPGDG